MKADVDAVVHFGTISGNDQHPDHRINEGNVMPGMHLLEATAALDADALCLASSINAIRSEWQHRPIEVDYLPVDEDHPRRPGDTYGVAKHALEVTADAFGRRPDNDLTISTLRLPWVPDASELRETSVDADRPRPGLRVAGDHTTRDALFAYVHIDDAARAARLAVEADFDGHETFWTVAPDTTAEIPTSDPIDDHYPSAERRRQFDAYESLIDVSKAEQRVDWKPEYSWRTL